MSVGLCALLKVSEVEICMILKNIGTPVCPVTSVRVDGSYFDDWHKTKAEKDFAQLCYHVWHLESFGSKASTHLDEIPLNRVLDAARRLKNGALNFYPVIPWLLAALSEEAADLMGIGEGDVCHLPSEHPVRLCGALRSSPTQEQVLCASRHMTLLDDVYRHLIRSGWDCMSDYRWRDIVVLRLGSPRPGFAFEVRDLEGVPLFNIYRDYDGTYGFHLLDDAERHQIVEDKKEARKWLAMEAHRSRLNPSLEEQGALLQEQFDRM